MKYAWRKLRPAVVLVVGSYLGVLAVLLALENVLVYHPAKASESWALPPSREVQDITLATGDGARIHAWWWPNGNRDALLFCHGNAGNLSHRGPEIGAIRQQLDVSVLIFDYPGYGKSDGQPSEAGCYAAANAAYQWLVDTEKVDPHRLIIFGESLGGGVAVDLAQRQPHRALVVVKTFTSAPDVARQIYPWLPVRLLMRNRFNNLEKIKACSHPVFVAHGTDDDLIPFNHGQQLYEAASSPKFFFPMPGIGHNDPLPPDLFTRIPEFLRECEK